LVIYLVYYYVQTTTEWNLISWQIMRSGSHPGTQLNIISQVISIN